jgi:hypothetical protein
MLTDLKFNEAMFNGRKISDLSDTPSSDGMTAADLKAYFDYIPKTMIALSAFNSLIDILESSEGANNIGASVDGLTGIKVNEILGTVKAMLDDRYTKEAADSIFNSKANNATVSEMVKSIEFNKDTGIFTITEQSGRTYEIDTLIEKIAVNFRYDQDTQSIVIVLADGTEQTIPISAFISENEIKETDTIKPSIVGGEVFLNIKAGSITDDMMSNEIFNRMQQYVTDAQSAMNNAKTSENNAKSYADAAALSASNALASKNSASASEEAALSYKNSAEESKNNAESAKTAAEKAKTDAQTAATEVSENKTIAEQAAIVATQAAESAVQSASSAEYDATAAKQSKESAALSEQNALESKNAAEESKAAAATSETNAAGSATAAQEAKTAAESAQSAAEKARDEAKEIAGGDFATKAELSDTNAELNKKAYSPVTITGTLSVGETSLELLSTAITTDSTIVVYTSKYGVNPTDVIAETGKVTLTFDPQETTIDVKVDIVTTGIYGSTGYDDTEIREELADKLTQPETASAGQIFKVQSINEDGSLVLEAVDMPSGVDVNDSYVLLADVTLEEDSSSVSFSDFGDVFRKLIVIADLRKATTKPTSNANFLGYNLNSNGSKGSQVMFGMTGAITSSKLYVFAEIEFVDGIGCISNVWSGSNNSVIQYVNRTHYSRESNEDGIHGFKNLYLESSGGFSAGTALSILGV